MYGRSANGRTCTVRTLAHNWYVQYYDRLLKTLEDCVVGQICIIVRGQRGLGLKAIWGYDLQLLRKKNDTTTILHGLELVFLE